MWTFGSPVALVNSRFSEFPVWGWGLAPRLVSATVAAKASWPNTNTANTDTFMNPLSIFCGIVYASVSSQANGESRNASGVS
jgi:hypothetical protein